MIAFYKIDQTKSIGGQMLDNMYSSSAPNSTDIIHSESGHLCITVNVVKCSFSDYKLKKLSKHNKTRRIFK